jgi:hypothetical protein|tara:strand:+ start:503 stop:679 length:177 start_codon:yes stop_codon:yes gene_type:complete
MINEKGLTSMVSEDQKTTDTKCNYCDKPLETQTPTDFYISPQGNKYCSFKHWVLFTED